MPRLPWDHSDEQARANQRRDSATTAVGVGAVAGGAALREVGIRRAHEKQARPKRMLLPGRSIALPKAGGKARLLYLGGSAAGLGGALAGGAGLYNLAHPKDRIGKRSFLTEGVLGSKDAVKDKVENLREPGVSNKARAAAAAGSVGAGTLGSLGVHRYLDRKAGFRAGRGKTRAALAATGGLVAGIGSLPLTSRAVSRGTGADYVITPTGVRRAKTKPIRPSKHAEVNTRPQHREFGKADDDYAGANMSRKQKRLAVYAAGAAGPLVGDAAAIGTAGALAPPHQRKKAAALQGAGAQGGQLAGATVGALGLRAAATRSPKIARGAQKVSDNMHPSSWMRAARGIPKGVHRKPSMLSRNAPAVSRQLGRAARKIGPVGMAGAAIGGFAGGHAGGFAGYGAALNSEDRWRKRSGMQPLAKAELMMASISKNLETTGLTQREHHEQLRRKKRNAALSLTSAGTGFAGLGLLAASRRRGIPAAKKAAIQRTAANTAVISGGIGATNSLEWAKIQRTDTKAQQRVAKVDPRHANLPPRSAEDVAWRRKVGNRHGPYDEEVRAQRREARSAQRASRHGGVDPSKLAKPHRLSSGIGNKVKWVSLAPAAGVIAADSAARHKGKRQGASNAELAVGAGAGGALLAANRVRDKIGRANVHPSRLHYGKVTAAALAGPALWAGARNRVEKQSSVSKRELRRRDIDAGAVGAAAAGFGYQAAGYKVSMRSEAHEKAIRADPLLRSKAKAHARRHKVIPGKTPAGAPEWKGYFRSYPKDLPGSQLKRVLAHTHGGKTGVALTGAAMAGGALAAGGASHKIRKSIPTGPTGVLRAKTYQPSIFRKLPNKPGQLVRVKAGVR